jgi:major type 1 subunit fimbrin (pilin)
MKKSLLSVSLLACLIQSGANAADGTITFNGEIITAACTVDTADANQTVDLGTVSSTAFGSAGTTASSAPINIKLTACDPAITKVGVRFDGLTDSDNPNLLRVNGGASGVGIALYETDNTLIPINTSSASKALIGGATATELNFIAKYMATVPAASITAGPANGTAQFTIDYN